MGILDCRLGAFAQALKNRVFGLFLLGALLVSAQLQAATVRILYIGNSMIYYCQMPEKIKAILESAGYTVEYQQETPGGWFATQHAQAGSGARTKLKDGINGNRWDYVIVNGQTMEPMTDYTGMLNALRTLKTDSDTYNPSAKFILHSTNPFRPDVVASLSNNVFVDTDVMADEIHAKYMAYGQALGVKVGPNTLGMKQFHVDGSKAWNDIWAPEDGKHHTQFSHSMAAYIYASMISGTDPTAFTQNLALSAADASYAKSVAKKAMVDSNQGFTFGTPTFTLTSGATYSIKALANDMYICAEGGGASPLVANRSAASTWEKFVVTLNADGTLSLLSKANNRYVSVDASTKKLIAQATTISNTEKFSWAPTSTGRVRLVSKANNFYVCADLNGSSLLYANRTSPSTWETFTFAAVAP